MTQILIDNRLYDLTDFRHPGGTIIKTRLFTEENQKDASFHFRQFHRHAESRARSLLRSFPSRPHTLSLSPEKQAIQQDFNKLYASYIERGFFNPSPLHMAYRFLQAFSMYFLGMLLICKSLAALSLQFALGMLLMCLAVLQFGWLEHECGHYSMVASPRLSKFLQWLLFDVFLGGSREFWNYQHNFHHASTQHIDEDIDLKTFPLIAYHEGIDLFGFKRVPFFIRYQHITWFWLNNSFVPSLWKYYIHPRYMIRKRRYVGYLFFTFLAEAIPTVAFSYFGGFSVLQGFLIRWAFVTIGLDMLLFNFTLSHTTQPVHDGKDIDWIDMASKHTVNIRSNVFIDWWMGLLNYQIEHHLFPQMPQFRHAETRKDIMELFAKHGLPYNEKGYFEGVKDVFVNLYNVKNKLIERMS